VLHGPVEQWGTDHAQGWQAEVDWHEDDYLDVGE
jgi:hypothetical protein